MPSRRLSAASLQQSRNSNAIAAFRFINLLTEVDWHRGVHSRLDCLLNTAKLVVIASLRPYRSRFLAFFFSTSSSSFPLHPLPNFRLLLNNTFFPRNTCSSFRLVIPRRGQTPLRLSFSTISIEKIGRIIEASALKVRFSRLI